MYEKGLNSRDHCCTYNAYVGSVEALIVSRDVINSRSTNFRHYGVTYVQKGVLRLMLDTGSGSRRHTPALSLRRAQPFLAKVRLGNHHLFTHNARVADVWWIRCIIYGVFLCVRCYVCGILQKEIFYLAIYIITNYFIYIL